MSNDLPQQLSETIFVIGDATDELSDLLALLAEYGYQVRTSQYSDQLLKVLTREPPGLILLMASLADDSYQCCQRLKSLSILNSTPVLFVCNSQARDLDLAKALYVGGSDYLSYPLRREEVIGRLEHQLAVIRLKQELKLKDQKISELSIQCQLLTQSLTQATQQMEAVSLVDNFTQLANRNYFDGYLGQQWRCIARDRLSLGEPVNLSMIICRLDKINPSELVLVANTIQTIVKRPADLLARYNESELVILLPNTTQSGALHLVELIKSQIKKLALPETVKLSLGTATEVPTQALSSQTLIDLAYRDLTINQQR